MSRESYSTSRLKVQSSGDYSASASRKLPSGHATAGLGLLVTLLVPVWTSNAELFLFLNTLHSPWTDQIWLGLTTLGDGLLLVIILGAFLFVNPRVTVFGLTLLLCASITINLTKILFPTMRPAGILESIHVIGPLLRSGSFPSGHTASVMVAALTVAHFVRSPSAGSIAIGVGVLTSLSRIFVGAHFPRDVIGGMIYALVLFIAFRELVFPKYAHRIPEQPDFSSRIFLAGFVLEVALVIFGMTYYAFRYAESTFVAIAVGLTLLLFIISSWRSRWTRSYS